MKKSAKRRRKGLVAAIRQAPNWAIREGSCAFNPRERRTSTEVPEGKPLHAPRLRSG